LRFGALGVGSVTRSDQLAGRLVPPGLTVPAVSCLNSSETWFLQLFGTSNELLPNSCSQYEPCAQKRHDDIEAF